jgi:hypothetical protein
MTNTTSFRDKTDLQHLSRISALTAEIATAIAAIERNDLPRLQAAIANQEKICSQLANTKWGTNNNKDAASPLQTERVKSAHAALDELNRVYAGLLKRSRRSVDLMLALYGNLATENAEPALTESQQTLSCEA